MSFLSRRGALNSAASFVGIGVAPNAKKGSETKEKPAEDVPEGETDANAKPSTATKPDEGNGREGDGGTEDDDNEEGDDEGDEEEMRTKGEKGKKVRSARLRERARIAAVMQHPSAAAHADLAMKMLLTTNLGRAKICTMLDAMPAASAGSRLDARMAPHAERHVHNAPPAISGQQTIDSSWDRAVEKVNKPFGAR